MWSARCILSLCENWTSSLWVEILVNFIFRSDQTFMMETVVSYCPRSSASERGGILALPHVRDAGKFFQLIVFFFSVKRKRNKKNFHFKVMLVSSRILESLAGCRTMLLFAVFCKIGALERNAYWFHVKLVFIVIFGQSFKLEARAYWISQLPCSKL